MRRDLIALGVLAIIAGFGLSFEVIPYQIDDASIFYRYATRIAAGLGPTFNAGDPAVEGFTSPLWTMLLALGARLFGAAVLPRLATVLGVLSTIGVTALLTRVAIETKLKVWMMLPVIAWACSPGASYYAVTGLETPLFVACVLAFHAALAGTLPPAFGFVAAVLSLWIRPEGAWLVLAAGAQLLASKTLQSRGRLALKLAVALSVSGALMLGVRLGVFGQWLPNTYFAKSPSLEHGLHYLSGALTTPWTAAFIGAALLVAVIGPPRERGLAVACFAWLLAAVVEGGDWMPAFRLMQPALVLAAAASMGLLMTRWRAVTAGAAVALVLLIGAEAMASWDQAQTAQRSLYERRAEAKTFVSWFQASGLHSIALVDIGDLGVECPQAVLTDLAGLTDLTIGRGAGGHLNEVSVLDYVLQTRRPEIVVIRLRREPGRAAGGELAPAPPDAMSQMEGNVLADPRLGTLYRPLFVFLPKVERDPLYARMVFLRRDATLPPEATFTTDTVFMDQPGTSAP